MVTFGGQLPQSPEGDSCRGEGANTGSQDILSALCPGGLAVAAVFPEKWQKKSRRPWKDFLLRGGAGGRRGFCFESSGQGDPMMGYFTTQNCYFKSKRTLS